MQVQTSNKIYEMLNHIGEERKQQFLNNRWWHSIDIGNGVITPGAIPHEELKANFAYLQLPDDLTGKRVLDIGCWDGFYSFECERRGAEVVSIDCWHPEGFFLAHEALKSSVQFHELSVYDLSRERFGSFDIVLFLGVLYHVRHPLLALERVCEMSHNIAVIETHVIDNARDANYPALEFYEFDELGGAYDNWFGPNTEALLAMIRAAGFVRPQVLQKHASRSVVRAYRHWETPAQSTNQTLVIRGVLNAINFKPVVPQDGLYANVAIWVEGLPAHVSREQLRVDIGGYATIPNHAGPSDGHTQINVPLPLGLPLGATNVRVYFEDQSSDESSIEITPGTMW